jgi:hypothetical protein
MKEAQAVTCCQRHQHNVTQEVPLSLGVKPALSADSPLSVALLSLPVLSTHVSGRAFFSTPQHPPPTHALYTLHCSLLI